MKIKIIIILISQSRTQRHFACIFIKRIHLCFARFYWRANSNLLFMCIIETDLGKQKNNNKKKIYKFFKITHRSSAFVVQICAFIPDKITHVTVFITHQICRALLHTLHASPFVSPQSPLCVTSIIIIISVALKNK